jgi:hypothetical protein
MSNKYDYPTLEKVKKASKRQLAFWYRFLPDPGENWKNHSNYKNIKNNEGEILDIIIDRLMPK